MQLIDTFYWSDQRRYYIHKRLPIYFLLYSSVSIVIDFVDLETRGRVTEKPNISNF